MLNNYPKYSETKRVAIILDEFVKIKWGTRNKKYYEQRGYEYTGIGTSFMCMVPDLTHGSSAMVRSRCPVCGRESKKPFHLISRQGHTLCQGCATTNDLTGIKFGRLLVTDRNWENDRVYWNCLCECGNTCVVRTDGLTDGQCTSCGCYAIEVRRDNLTGKNNPSWTGGEIDFWCGWCGRKYKNKRSKKGKSRFCSVRCWGKWKSKNLSGENSPRWDSSISEEEREKRRLDTQVAKWAKRILKKDNWTCQYCLKYGGDLEAHHLFNYRDYPDVRTDINNGHALCRSCHFDFHINFMGGWGVPCTPGDYYAWLADASLDVTR